MIERKRSPPPEDDGPDKPGPLDELFFEGPEKLLEMWFVPSEKDEKDLRVIPQQALSAMLDLVHCKILTKASNKYFDAYVLSESSLFVFSWKIILKTCGTTTLLLAVPEILRIAKLYCGLTLIGDVFYSRRNFFYEVKQLEPHGSWEQEVKFLDNIFSGSRYTLGRDDQWYLYLTDREEYAENVGEKLPLPLISDKKTCG